MRIVYQLCTGWQDFDWLEASRGPSALAELLVNTITTVLVRDNSEKLQVHYIDWLRVCHLVLSCLDGRDVPVCPSHLSHPVVPVVRPRPVVHAIHLQHTAQTRVTARPRLVLEENCHTGRCQYCCIWKNSGLDVWWTEMITANNEAIAHFITALNQDFRFWKFSTHDHRGHMQIHHHHLLLHHKGSTWYIYVYTQKYTVKKYRI